MRKTILIILVISTFAACKKEESPNPASYNRTPDAFPGPKAEMIIAKKWKLTDKTVDYSNGLPSENFNNVPDCQKDNLFAFKSNRKYDINETTDVCPGNPSVTTLSWTTNDGEQSVTLNGTKYEIVSLSSTTMKLRNIITSPPITVTTVETYTAQ